MVINITSFSHLVKRVDFDAKVDHLALTHIIKSKVKPTTTRIKRLLEFLSSYSVNLYYIKGKHIILSDFLSKLKHDDSIPYEIIPILFNMPSLFHTRYYNICEGNSGKYLVETQSQVKSSGIKLPEVHGIGKSLNPNMQLEKQVVKPIAVTKAKEISQIKPRLGQGRAELRCKIKTQISKPLTQVMEKPPSKVLLLNTSKYKI